MSGSDSEAGRGSNYVDQTLAWLDSAAVPDHAAAELALHDAPCANHAYAPIRAQVCAQVLRHRSTVDCRASYVNQLERASLPSVPPHCLVQTQRAGREGCRDPSRQEAYAHEPSIAEVSPAISGWLNEQSRLHPIPALHELIKRVGQPCIGVVDQDVSPCDPVAQCAKRPRRAQGLWGLDRDHDACSVKVGLNLLREMVSVDRDFCDMPPYTGNGKVQQRSVVYRAKSLRAHFRQRTQALALACSKHYADQIPQDHSSTLSTDRRASAAADPGTADEGGSQCIVRTSALALANGNPSSYTRNTRSTRRA